MSKNMKMEDDARPHGQEEILIEPQRIPDKINYSILSGETCFSNIQVGGNHYKKLVIQPTEYAYKNKLDFFQGNVVKYITRFRDKNGLEDLKKAKHFIDLLIQFEYGEEGDSCQNKHEGCTCAKGQCTCKDKE